MRTTRYTDFYFWRLYINVPRKIRQNNLYEWNEGHSDYTSSGGYTAYAYFIGPSKLTLTGVADGDEFTFTLSAANSLALTADEDYKVEIRFENGSGGNYTLGVATVEVLPSMAAQVAGYETRGHVKKVFDALKAAIEGRATQAQESMTVGGKSIQLMSMTELITAYHHYEKLYNQELRAEKVAEGLATGSKILVRMDR